MLRNVLLAIESDSYRRYLEEKGLPRIPEGIRTEIYSYGSVRGVMLTPDQIREAVVRGCSRAFVGVEDSV